MAVITDLDRVTVQVRDLAAARHDWERLLGVASVAGEGHARRFQFWNAALELREETEPTGGGPLTRLVFATRDPRPVSPVPALGVRVELETAPSRPALSQAFGEARAAVVALDHVVLRCADLDASLVVYRDGLGLRLALDRSFPSRGVRLVFFRVGGVTVELSGDLERSPERLAANPPDAIWGLAWRVLSIEAAHRRLSDAGVPVSPIRPGHKDGTRVASVEDAPSAVPTLMLEDPHRSDRARADGARERTASC